MKLDDLRRHLRTGALARTPDAEPEWEGRERWPEEQAAIEFQLDYDVTKPQALRLIDAVGIAETERLLKRAKEARLSVFHPSITGHIVLRDVIDA